jgi:O-methyltransferase
MNATDQYIESCFKDISDVCYSTKETQLNSYTIGFSAENTNVEGDIVECGIAAGGNFAMMIHGVICANEKTPRTFWGYDSFEGIQLAGSKDTEQAGIGAIKHDTNVPPAQLLVSSGITVHSEESVIENLKKWGLYDKVRIKLVKGWVQNSLLEDTPESIAILRLDMDVYDPTIFVLRLLYDRISKGGIIIIDDWALTGVRVAVEEFWAEKGIKPEILTIENSTPIYWIKE